MNAIIAELIDNLIKRPCVRLYLMQSLPIEELEEYVDDRKTKPIS